MYNVLLVGKGLITTSLAESLNPTKWKVNFHACKEQNVKTVNLSKYDYVVSCLPDATVATKVWRDILETALKSNCTHTIFIEISTLTCDAVVQINKSFNNKNLTFIEAPFTGSKTGALNGSMVYFTYSERANTLDNPFLTSTSSKIYTFNQIGAATQFKLFYNLWGLTALGLFGQMIHLIEALHQSDLAINIITSNDDFWMNAIAKQKLNQSLIREYQDIHCKLKYAKKDIKYALDEFSDHRLDLSQCLLSILEADKGKQYDEFDFTAMSEFFR